MDHFGIGQAMQGMARVYILSSRRTGRTTSLVQSLKKGDRVVCANDSQRRHLLALCRERSLEVDVMVVSPQDPQLLFRRGTAEGRTIFDHSWVETYYLAAIERCRAEIDHLQTQTSGWGEAHEETRRQAIEISKWSLS